MKGLHLIFVTLVICYHVHWIGHVECSRSPSIPCQLVEIIEELDPKDQHMAPRFYKKKICSGGLKLTTGHQCQPKSTEKKYLKLYDTRQSKFEQKVYESATACHEVCVCPRKSCTNPKIGICGKYMRWDKEKCHCVCDTQSVGYTRTGKPDHVPIKFFFISFSLVFTMCFLVTAILITVCYLKYKRKKDRYSLLYRVEWNEEQKEKLEKYMDYVDGPESSRLFKKRWWQFCCTKNRGKGEKDKLLSKNGDGDQVDSASAIQTRSADKSAYDCFNIGYIAFKRDKFDMMLQWMNEAERKWKDKNKEQQMNHTDENSYQFEANEDPVEILDEGELYEYLALANFTAVAGNLENAKEYKRKALELRNRAKAGTNGTAQERRVSDELNANMQVQTTKM